MITFIQSDAPAAEETTPKVVAKNAAMDQAKAFIAGGFGGTCAVLVGMFILYHVHIPAGCLIVLHSPTGHPFDLTKTRLQTAAPGVYTGALDVVKKTIARDGVTGCVILYSYLSMV